MTELSFSNNTELKVWYEVHIRRTQHNSSFQLTQIFDSSYFIYTW